MAATPEAIWSLLAGPNAWPGLYPGVSRVDLLDGQTSLRQGARFDTDLAGQDVAAQVAEFEPMTRIARTGGPEADAASVACHYGS